MNDLLNIKVRHKETKELFTLTGFLSAGDSHQSFVTTLGLKPIGGIRAFGVNPENLNKYELVDNL